jgi:hypothetical protein
MAAQRVEDGVGLCQVYVLGTRRVASWPDTVGVSKRRFRPDFALWLFNLTTPLEEIGNQFSVTRERIRQIEAKTLRKLKHPHHSRKLRSFLDI